MTVTGAAVPSSSKTCVMPTLIPSKPIAMKRTLAEATVYPGRGPVSIIALTPVDLDPIDRGSKPFIMALRAALSRGAVRVIPTRTA